MTNFGRSAGFDYNKRVKMMMTCPQGLVRFQVYHDKENKAVTIADRRRNRMKNKNIKNPPLDLWANWVVNSSLFQNAILALILVNSVVLGIQAEITDYEGSVWEMVRQVLDIFDYCTMLVFVVEIILKWIDSFWAFWKNNWNIFDFFVTFLSFVPEIIKYSMGSLQDSATSDLTVVADNMRTFRVLRSLKMVSRFQKIRLIVLAVTKAFQAMLFITVLLFIFKYIFAIIGVSFFDYSKATEKLHYQNSFSSMVNALITLFQLFTLDHWIDVYNDVKVVAGEGIASLYVILWIIIGSFIFRNIFVGIMVNNFQSIRNDMFQEIAEMKDCERRDQELQDFAVALDRQNNQRRMTLKPSEMGIDPIAIAMDSEDKEAKVLLQKMRNKKHISIVPLLERMTLPQPHQSSTSVQSRFGSVHDLREALSQHVVKEDKEGEDWQSSVEKNLENLSREETSFCWPRDTLFRYLLLMEMLQENLHERQHLLQLATEALLQIHDA